MQRPPVTVVVPTRDRADRLAGCLDSVLQAMGDGDELVVVDSASRDPGAVTAAVTAAQLRSGRPLPVRALRLEQPGVDRARNAGWRAGRHALLVFTDDDVVVDAGWVDAFAASYAGHPEVGFLTGRVLPPTNEPPTGWPVAIKNDPLPQTFDRTSVGNLGHGASTAFPRAALEAVGGWDESLGAGSRLRSAPEADLYDRVLALGWTGRYEPTALAWHPQWRTPRELVRLNHGYGIGNGARIRKLWAADRVRARAVTGDGLWSWGLLAAARARDRLTLACAVSRLAGTARGAVSSLRYRIVDGHLVPRRGSSAS